jgi:hypothetical protein
MKYGAHPKYCYRYYTFFIFARVSVVVRLRTGRMDFNFRHGSGLFSFAIASRPTLGPRQLPIQLVPWGGGVAFHQD